MQSSLAALASRKLRASDAFVLVAFDELDPDERRRLGALREAPDFFGLLKPVDPRLPAKSVTRDAALLLLALRRPQRIPTLLASMFGEDASALHALLADGVLEVEHDGTFVSGHEALQLFGDVEPARPAQHPVSRLSAAAIECATSYEGLDAAALSRRIYAFGRQPCTAELRRRFSRDAELVSFLADASVAALLTAGWSASADREAPWLSWSSGRTSPRLGYKLYVSPRLDAMPRVFGASLRALARTRCDHFKVGRHAEGLCRPDKMVAYFPSLERLHECAALIEAELRAANLGAASAHGVAFTAGIDAAGFLSWGTDPPDLADLTHGQSWRQWITDRVGVAVISARNTSSAADVLSFVLQRLKLDGIDPSTWAPTLAIWRTQVNQVDGA